MKKLISIISAIALIIGITACASKNNSDESSNSSKEESQVTSETTQKTDTSASVTEAVSEPVIEVIETEYTLGGDITDAMKAHSLLIDGNQARIGSVIKKAQSGEKVTIGFIGGSITQGSSATSNNGYAVLIQEWWKNTFPNVDFTFVNAGIGGTGSYIGVHRVDKDVLSSNPDLVFVEFSVNDGANSERDLNSYDSLVRKIWNYNTNPAVICISMTQENGTSFQEQHKKVCEKYDIPMISYKNAVLPIIDAGYINWSDISPDNIHPNDEGHRILKNLLVNYLESVKSGLDNIPSQESDISEALTKDFYKEAVTLDTSANGLVEIGNYEVRESKFGGFSNYFYSKEVGTSLIFEVECRNIGILYGKLVSGGAVAEIIVDGKTIKTLSANFKDGWGNYMESDEIIKFEETSKHTVEIKSAENDGGTKFIVGGLLIS